MVNYHTYQITFILNFFEKLTKIKIIDFKNGNIDMLFDRNVIKLEININKASIKAVNM